VIVPTHRRSKLLARCLAALLDQDFDSTSYEIIVADNAGDITTQKLVESWPTHGRAPLRYLQANHRPGPAAARNAGWKAARGEFIAFTDDDCIPDRGWLRAGVTTLEQGADAASGRILVPLPAEPTDYERNEAGLEKAEFATANCFCRRQALAAVGGFDEQFTAAWREDSDLHFALLEHGRRIARVPEALVTHPVRPASWGVSLGQQRKSQFNALLYKKHPKLYRARIQRSPPWFYYLATGTVLAALGASLAGRSGFALGAAGVWLLLTAWFCARRLRNTRRSLGHVLEMVMTSALIPPLSVYWRLRGALRFGVLFL
jgi:glycosyltransferase involved in cell wall biosynthesis